MKGHLSFLRLHHEAQEAESQQQWLCVISNLVENSDIERPSDSVDVLKSLRQIEPESERLLE